MAAKCGDANVVGRIDFLTLMASLDSVSIAILLGAALVMAGILSSLLALRFGAPLLLVFLAVGMLAGDSGPGQIEFNDVRTTYLVGSVALALILFDGGLRTRFQSIRSVLAPSMVLATIGVLLTALITAPVAKYAPELNWTEALLVGAVVASTDAAAVFLLVHAQGLRLRARRTPVRGPRPRIERPIRWALGAPQRSGPAQRLAVPSGRCARWPESWGAPRRK